ncbi:LacI family DNA-binding transcriptional regulator [Microbacterium sp.]|uniref:LacI family DNA-binding transcriptional regulator n=1 Tax=Microbacterium sp. TaxID=51671 RepID=UPI003A8AC6A0
MVGISDVARAAGVSKATASRALSGAGYVSTTTRARVLAAADELGYVPSTSAVSLATGRTQNIGVVMPYVNRWFFAEVLEGIQRALLDRGLDLTLYDARPGSPGRERIFDDFLARKRFDGLIAVGVEPRHDEIDRLLSIGRPVVTVVGPDSPSSLVEIDDDAAARRATDHLLTLGHTQIAFLGGTPGEHWARVERRRLAGYEAAMTEAGVSDAIRHVRCVASIPGGYEASVDLLTESSARVTGLVAVCDEVAIGAIVAARQLGIAVPARLSIVGFDDHEYAEMFGLTTLRQNPREQGFAAVELLVKHLEDPTREPERIRMPARMVVRGSTAAPPSAPDPAGAVPERSLHASE